MATGRRCRVKDCLSDSRRPEDLGVTFHKVPFHTDIRPKWLSLCKIPQEHTQNKVIYVCSRHFRRNDFCTFKGTKYMLKQGVLPSMFPWTNNRKNTTPKEEIPVPPGPSTSTEPKVDTPNSIEKLLETLPQPVLELEKLPEKTVAEKTAPTEEVFNCDAPDLLDKINKLRTVKPPNTRYSEKRSEIIVPVIQHVEELKKELPEDTFNPDCLPVTDFTQGTKVEVTDLNGSWFPAKISEVDYTENEVFIEFEDSSKSNEWIPMDSKRLRQYIDTEKSMQFEVGERVMAQWKNSIRFPAIIQKCLENDTYEVLFDDNIPSVLKASKISRATQKKKTPLFAPVEGSKQDRRDRKRKINVAELFNKKRIKSEDSDTEEKIPPKPASPPTSGEWICRWLNGEPVGIPSSLDSRKSVIVQDPKTPAGWTKHFVCRAAGSSAGKWEAIFVSPDGKRFRCRSDVQAYLDKNRLSLSLDQFDFSLHLKRARALGLYEYDENFKKQVPKTPVLPSAAKGKVTQDSEPKEPGEIVEATTETPNSLKIIVENGSYKCPIEGCNKNFRRENLAQMHVKHYHPEFSKLIGSTPNVADLAYARTVGEPIEDHSKPIKTISSPIHKPETPKITKVVPKPPETPKVTKVPPKPVEPEPPKLEPEREQQSEIVKLLTEAPKLTKIAPLVKKPDMVPEKFKETPVSKVGGIRTLLPVIRTPVEPEKTDCGEPVKSSLLAKQALGKHLKRKRNNSEETYRKRRYTKHEYDYDPEFDQESRSPEYTPSFNRRRKHTEYSPEYNYQPYQHPPSNPLPPQQPKHIVTETGEVIKIVSMKQEEIINCTCGFMEEDGLMIQCELCLCWQHAYCNSIEREDQVPDKYICYICQNPLRMRSSRKYMHDQDWLKQGALPVASFHAKDEAVITERFQRLRQTHELSGNLHELSNVMHSLRVKLKMAENKDHAKFYLWSKPWPKQEVDNNIKAILEAQPEKQEIKKEPIESSLSRLLNSFNPEQKAHGDTIQAALNSAAAQGLKKVDERTKLWVDNGDIAGEVSDGEMISQALASEALANDLLASPNGLNLAQLSQSDIEKIQNTIENSGNLVNQGIPEPEAKIESDACRDNLLDHISSYQSQIADRMDRIEEEIARLEMEDVRVVTPRAHVDQKMKETFIMMLRDLGKMRKLAALY